MPGVCRLVSRRYGWPAAFAAAAVDSQLAELRLAAAPSRWVGSRRSAWGKQRLLVGKNGRLTGAAAGLDEATGRPHPAGSRQPMENDMQHRTTLRQPSQGLWRIEVYGDSAALETVALANGGTGATGLLRALADAYQASHRRPGLAIAWHQQISGDALAALARHDVAIALTYDPPAEQHALTQQQASA